MSDFTFMYAGLVALFTLLFLNLLLVRLCGRRRGPSQASQVLHARVLLCNGGDMRKRLFCALESAITVAHGLKIV